MEHIRRQHESAPRPLGPEGQKPIRQAQRTVRKSAVSFGRWAHRKGIHWYDLAGKIGVRPNTLGRWVSLWQLGRLPAPLLGRPQRLVGGLDAMEVQHHIEVMGPSTGMPALKSAFPEVTRSQLRDMRCEYRHQWVLENPMETQELIWTVPGAVWAADFSDAPHRIDGAFDYVLATRDLASLHQHPCLPAVHKNSITSAKALEAMFYQYGAPLVAKIDNGSEFKGYVRELLVEHLVIPLLSPAYWPQYNGSIEAGMGPLKTRMHYEAVRNGRVGEWSSDDLESSRYQINHSPRPELARRFNLPVQLATPQHIWQTRKPITNQQRWEFVNTVNVMRDKVVEEFNLVGKDRTRRQRATVAREAISRALVALGYLMVRRKCITPPFNLKKTGIIR